MEKVKKSGRSRMRIKMLTVKRKKVGAKMTV